MAEKATEGTATFEEKLESVQEIIVRIEEGRIPLEDSVKQFEEGMKTLGALEEELKDMNRRLTVLRSGGEAPMTGAGEEP